jgi:uncharacterized membrane protein YsdA (DUF1294 family)
MAITPAFQAGDVGSIPISRFLHPCIAGVFLFRLMGIDHSFARADRRGSATGMSRASEGGRPGGAPAGRRDPEGIPISRFLHPCIAGVFLFGLMGIDHSFARADRRGSATGKSRASEGGRPGGAPAGRRAPEGIPISRFLHPCIAGVFLFGLMGIERRSALED